MYLDWYGEEFVRAKEEFQAACAAKGAPCAVPTRANLRHLDRCAALRRGADAGSVRLRLVRFVGRG